MSVDEAWVRRVAALARIAITEERVPQLARELDKILDFVEQLSEVDTEDVAPLTSAVDSTLRMRADMITDGNIVSDILKNAPVRDEDYFAVPKVIE